MDTCCTPFVDLSHPWIIVPQPWIKGFSMDARKCLSEPCIRFMENYPRMTLADPWMGGSGHNERMKFIKNNHNLVVAMSA